MIFLRAEWRQLAMLNYEVDAARLASLVPHGTELDDWRGRFYMSVVGFLFLNTSVLGIAVPFHRNFEEVNLRLYVRRRAADGWRRGVVFVKEIVPRAAIAFVARALYNENYVALPMRHRAGSGSVSYEWTVEGRQDRLSVASAGDPQPLLAGSEEEFIAEHYWGYARQRDGGTVEYRVEHPRWRVAPVSEALLECDVARLYGEPFVECLKGKPTSAFLAEGSAVAVHRGVRLPR
jgi:uncharacterized protein YqjF (DUF2071 family)